MLPLLSIASDGKEHTLVEAIDTVSNQFGLSESELETMLPSGTQTQVYNRGTWAVTYLTKSGLLDKPARGRFKITPRGTEALKQAPKRIDNTFLKQYDEYRAFIGKRNSSIDPAVTKGDADPARHEPGITPDEHLEAAYKELRDTLADELLSRVRATTPKRFEELVVDVLVAMGYGGSRRDAAQVVGKSGDGGIDGVIKEDLLGLDMVYVQAKRYEADIGPGAIREFVGSLGERRAHKGVFITCGSFTQGAKDAAVKAHTRIVLIDGGQLAEYMIDHGVGVSNQKTYTVKKLDGDYFDIV